MYTTIKITYFFLVEIKCGVKYYTGSAGTSGKINIGEYDNSMSCDYNILTGDPDLTISISIERLDIEYSQSCIFDALLVRHLMFTVFIVF